MPFQSAFLSSSILWLNNSLDFKLVTNSSKVMFGQRSSAAALRNAPVRAEKTVTTWCYFVILAKVSLYKAGRRR